MTRSLTLGTALAVLLTASLPAAADTLLGSYVARLSDNDHYASDGYKLDTAAQVVRQDRANWHRFGRGDAEDDDDQWFGTADARARLERHLNQSGAMTQAVRREIMSGEPIVKVTVYRESAKVVIVGY
jgi:hypothetical protein